MRLRYASVALLVALVSACGPQPFTAQEAMDVARSHVVGDALIHGARNGRLGDLAPDTSVGDPNRLVWVVSLRGVFQLDCKLDATRTMRCPKEPVEGILVLDYFDGSSISVTRIRVIPATEPPPTNDPGIVS